jgi:hypothetical protein
MALVNISEAARLAGISRSHLYRHYLKPGKLSLSKNELGQPVIETSELLRLFGTLHVDSRQATGGNTPTLPVNTPTEAILQERLQGLEQLLKAYQEELGNYRSREQDYWEREKAFYRLLEDKPPKKKRWWPFK